MSNEIKMEDEKDEFPIGLRVLSVDDDLVCLRILEANLIQCKYKVTSTTSAIEALNMLRQNKNNYDIIITDVHMPDMDGFKLLKHVGLEMDLPCIVLSANDDPNTVLKGIEHGACGYLLKPVRVEELKNIWQHVIRKKNGCKKHINSNNTTSDDVKGGNINRKPHTKKRNQKNDDEKEKDEETISAIESVSTKKSRIAWTQELHQKFVDAIEVMGVNKAVPKKILELMNVEGLSRASVASHLQKYRLYLKKLEDKANVIALMGLRDQHLNTAAFDSHKDFQSCSSSSNHIQTLQPYQQNTLGKGNSRMALGNNNVAHGLAQVRLPPHINNPINSHENRFHQGNIHRQMPPTSQKRLLIPEKNSFNGFQKPSYTYWLSHVNGNISMPMSSTMIHSTVASDSLPMNVNACMNNVNFASTNGSVPRSTIGVYNNHPTVDPMPMVNVANDGSNYLNFGNASQSRNRNIALGSQFDWQPLFDPYSSHSQRLNVGSNDIGTNSNEHQDYNNNMPLAQQQCKFIKSSPDNPFKNGDDISSLDNSLLQGDLGPSGCIFYGLENLIQQE